MKKLAICIVDCGSNKVPRLLDVLEKLGCSCGQVKLEEANRYSFSDYSALVISGGPRLFTNEEEVKQLICQFEFIRTIDTPVLGICLGHQAIGVLHGVTPYLGEERRSEDCILITGNHPFVEHLGARTIFKEDHCEGIPLPAGFDLLGFSKYYPVEIMACRYKPFFGVQFHPEASGEPGEILFRNFLKIVQSVSLS